MVELHEAMNKFASSNEDFKDFEYDKVEELIQNGTDVNYEYQDPTGRNLGYQQNSITHWGGVARTNFVVPFLDLKRWVLPINLA